MDGHHVGGSRHRISAYTNQKFIRTGEEPARDDGPPEQDLLLSTGRRSQLPSSAARANAEWPRETLGWDRAKDILAKAMLVAIPMLLAPLIVTCALALIGVLALSAKALAIAAAVTALVVLAMSIYLAVRFLSEPPIVDFSTVQQEPSLPTDEDNDSRLLASWAHILREPAEPTRLASPFPTAPTESNFGPAARFSAPVSSPPPSPSTQQPVDQIAPQLPTSTEQTSTAVHAQYRAATRTLSQGRSRRPPPVQTNVDDRPPSTVLQEARKRAASKMWPSQNAHTNQPKPAVKNDDSLLLGGHAQIGRWRN